MPVGLSIAPQLPHSLGGEMSSLERVRMAAAAPVAQQHLDEFMDPEPAVLSDLLQQAQP